MLQEQHPLSKKIVFVKKFNQAVVYLAVNGP